MKRLPVRPLPGEPGRGSARLRGVCFLLSVLIAGLSLLEALVRWDAMAGPFRIILRLIGTGKLSPGDVLGAVLPDLAACLYPLCVFLGFPCGAFSALSALRRGRGRTAAAAYFALGVLTLVLQGGTALKGLCFARAGAYFLAGGLFLVRALSRRRRGRPVREEKDPPRSGRRIRSAEGAERKNALSGTEKRPRLFSGEERRPLFRREGDRERLFPHGESGGKKKGRRE